MMMALTRRRWTGMIEERLLAARAPRLGEHTDRILVEVLNLGSGATRRLHDLAFVAGIQ